MPVVELRLIERLSERVHPRHLLVDSGFTGASDLIISYPDARLFGARRIPASLARGALSGAQIRVEVRSLLPASDSSTLLAAICADLAPLSLPNGVEGVVGLTFLSRFREWGAVRGENKAWSFRLDADD